MECCGGTERLTVLGKVRRALPLRQRVVIKESDVPTSHSNNREQSEQNATTDDEGALSEPAAAKLIGVSHGTLRLWRKTDNGPNFFRAGKLIRYRRKDVDDWIIARLNKPPR